MAAGISRVYAVVGSGDSENIIREGTELLNNSSLQGYMKRNKEQKAEVLHAVGDGYFYSEQYDTGRESIRGSFVVRQ